MYCVIQFYIQLKEDLAPHRPFLKVLCIKLVIFFCFWQSWIISLLTAEGGPLKATDQIAGPDLRIGIPSMLTCVEMAIFALLHLFAFPWKPYDLKSQSPLDTASDGFSAQPSKYAKGPARAILGALNPWDIIKACGRGFRWLFYGARHRETDASYQTKLDPVTTNSSYNGPTFAGNGEPIGAPASTQKKNEGFGDSDTTGLLSDAQANPYMQQGSSSYDSAYGPGASTYGSPPNPDRLPQAPLPGQEYDIAKHGDGRFQNFEQQDTTYHGGAADVSYYERPRYYQGENAAKPSTDWDMFAGAQRPQGGNHQPRWI